MVRINVEEIKGSLEELHQHNIVFEELDKGLFEESLAYNHDYARFGMIISEIKGKKSIVSRLKSLEHNVGLLSGIISAKSGQKHRHFVTRIIENNLNCMNSVIGDLSLLKNNLEELENLNSSLLSSRLPLDIKILLEQNYGRKRKKLDEIYAKQKAVLVNLSSIFIKLAKKSAFSRR
ncbi:hypothetical protein HYU50_05525 [Candidatus Woesearchaeota archaeon]|nr:hypothetical protein [Candidatus Woesearchaeota archaeon]